MVFRIRAHEGDGSMMPESISIVGGMGRMGRLFGRLFEEAGHRVQLADTLSGPISWEEAAECDVVLLAVPIPQVEEVVVELGPHTRRDGVVIDIASVKEGPVQAMLRHCNGEVIGSHPLFGPSINSLENQVLFVCPTGPTRWLEWYRSFYEDRGATVVEIDPARHDRLMASVQALRHLLLLCLGRSLMNLDFDLAADVPRSGPWFSDLIAMLARQSEQPGDLYCDIALHNRHMEQALTSFCAAVREICDLYRNKDRSNMTRVMREVSHYVLSGGMSNRPT
jgi:prephenate dehydrogenase